MFAEYDGPAGEVVGDHSAGEPGGVGRVVARRDVFGSACFQLADRQLHDGVLAVEPVGGDGVEIGAVGDEAVVSRFGEQAGLGGVGEAYSATDGSIPLT